ncbi:hypothetical protein D1P53_005995 [Cryptococcus gattii VGV]|nr:hypothetical protein D1P53_005995 [Cryptococcus gattii VGV]
MPPSAPSPTLATPKPLPPAPMPDGRITPTPSPPSPPPPLPAQVGLGLLHGEEQLKNALQSKDRMFLLVLAKEFEAFVARAVSTTTTVGQSAQIAATPTSKFQRMLVYKAAEWYGLKAVAGPEASMVVGVLGPLDEKSTALRLADLVPAAPSLTQKFRIMQRTPALGERPDSASSSDMQSNTADARASRWKTLEEREAAYAAAREKIYGKSGDVEESASVSKTEGEPPSRAAAALEDDIDPVPRRRYPAGGQFEVVYPSLYHPPKGSHTPSPAPGMADQYQQNLYGYQQTMGYAYQMDMNSYPLAGQMPGGGYTHPPPQQAQPQQGYAMQSYMDNQYNMSQQQQTYPIPGWQQPQGGGAYPQMTPNQQYSLMQAAQQNGQQWQYQQMVNQPMPMIPQGMPYPAGPAFGYPSSQPLQPQQRPAAMYPSLVQPSPQRPGPQPHSSASSSISSQSYQDGSRPHSRGSTTSTRSAASSVRLGAMYPAAQGPGPGYRQKGMKPQGLNGMTSLGPEGKRTRGHSPSQSSTTTTASSHSSRRTSSINVPPPSQHQLPQRPDWAANNVPYHPSPIIANPSVSDTSAAASVHHQVAVALGPNTAEFPPLLRSSTAAEPMQVERAKMRPMNGSVWNGGGGGAVTPGAGKSLSSGPLLSGQGIPPAPPVEPRVSILPGPRAYTHPLSDNQTQTQTQTQTAQSQLQLNNDDPDFPRRAPSKSAATLYDPSAPRSSIPQSAPGAGASQGSRPSSPSLNHGGGGDAAAAVFKGDTDRGQDLLSPEEVIEAKLAAVSLSAGVSIGPPPTKYPQPHQQPQPAQTAQTAASYAKIVQRD